MIAFLIYLIASIATAGILITASACLRIARILEKSENCMCFENDDSDMM